MRFRDRHDAGERLAAEVAACALDDPVVLALPRSGVPVGFEVARRLGASFDVIVARKVGAPYQPEFGIGAIAEGGAVVADDEVLAMLDIDHERFEVLAHREEAELQRRVRDYRGGRELPAVAAHDVVLVDDGLATGVTAHAAALSLGAAGARRIVLAVPVCSVDGADRLSAVVDAVVAVLRPHDFASVGQWYRDFTQTTDREVLDLLDRSRH